MNIGWKSLIAGVLGRFAAPPPIIMLIANGKRDTSLPILDNGLRLNVEVNDIDLSVPSNDRGFGIMTNALRMGVNHS